MRGIWRSWLKGTIIAQRCNRPLAYKLNVHLSVISHLKRGFREFGSTSTQLQNPRKHVTTFQDLPIQWLHLQNPWDQPPRHFTALLWVSSLLMSTLWIKWPVVTVGLWYGQAHVKANENKCILLMAFWTHNDTIARRCNPLLCYSSPHVAA